MPFIRELLEITGIEPRALDGIVLGNGPGSFIGLRIAASVAQGLAYAAGLRILPVSSLAAIAAQAIADHDARSVLVAQDARMEQLYVANYGARELRHPARLERPVLRPLADPLPKLSSDTETVAGDAWQKHVALRRLIPPHCQLCDIGRPDARWLLDLGARMLADGEFVAADEVELLYVRHDVAEPAGRS